MRWMGVETSERSVCGVILWGDSLNRNMGVLDTGPLTCRESCYWLFTNVRLLIVYVFLKPVPCVEYLVRPVSR